MNRPQTPWRICVLAVFENKLRWRCLCGLAIAAGLSAASLLAQDAPAQPGAIPTLHVYSNLVQIPVLVLTPEREKLSSPIAQNRFSISFDGGPRLRPAYARLEGDDPIDLSIVLDTRLPQADLLQRMDQAIADLAPSFLHPSDHVSIYAIDCSTMDYVEDLPAESRPLKRAVDAALSRWTARRHGVKAACNSETRLWDLLAFVTDKLSSHSGRRVVLAITGGRDKNSRRSSTDLATMAQIAAVTIFGLDPSWDGSSLFQSGDDVTLSNACELTGGLMLNPNGRSATRTMQHFTEMLRERYILEFPRPPNAQPGKLVMSVSIDKLNAFIRLSGDGVPVANQAQVADSSTVHPGQPFVVQDAVLPAESVPVAEARSEPVSTAQQQPAQQPPVAVPVAVEAAVPAQPPATAPVVAQQPSPSAVTPTLKVATKLTVEDVTVTDAQRKPVHGLARSDFTIKEDGKPQPIRDFEEYGAEKQPPQTIPAQLPANVYTNAQPAPADASAVNVLLLDDVTTGLANRLVMAPENVMYPREEAINYLKRMPPGTQVSILQLGDGLHLVQGVTTDRAILLAALKTVSFKMAAGSDRNPPANAPEACRRMNTQSQMVVEALDQAAAFLSGIKVRKNLIWFTPGVPWLTNYFAFSGLGCLIDYTLQLQRAYGLLNEAQVALYPVDPRGLPAGSFSVGPGANLKESPAQAGAIVPLKESAAQQLAIVAAFPAQNAAEQASLQNMADATGGVPFFSRNDLDNAVEEAIATGADYYSLSYVPPLIKYDGQYHKINVNVDRPNLNLQYRPGYTSVDLTKLAESSERKSSKAEPPPPSALDLAMVHGAAPSTQLVFDVRVIPSTALAKPGDPLVIGALDPKFKGKSLIRYDLVFSLSGDQIALVDGPGGTRKGSIEFVVAAYDAQGKMLNFLGQTAKWTLKPEQVSQFVHQSLQVPMQFDLPSGKIFVRLGVLDVSSQEIGTLEIPETVAK
jgi:VWFA-related protein